MELGICWKLFSFRKSTHLFFPRQLSAWLPNTTYKITFLNGTRGGHDDNNGNGNDGDDDDDDDNGNGNGNDGDDDDNDDDNDDYNDDDYDDDNENLHTTSL